MSVLAFKALSVGAERIPDKFFEKIPGGYFTPQEKKEAEQNRKSRKDKDAKDKQRHKSEQRSSRRDRTPPTDYSEYSAYTDDEEYERERQRRRRERRRAKSAGRDPSRGRHSRTAQDPDNMAHADRGEQPYFPPPPTGEYKPYNPQEYSARSGQDSYDAANPYGYPPQVNRLSRTRRATLPMMPEHPTPVDHYPPVLNSWVSANAPSPVPFPFRNPFQTTTRSYSYTSPLRTSFTPSYEPPFAARFHRPPTNPPQPASPAYPPGGQPRASSTAARYTPGPGYAPSPVQPGGPSPTSSYAPYNPADYPPSSAGYTAPGNAYPSPPPMNRNRSNSQPPDGPYAAPYQTYTPPASNQQVATYYDQPPARRSSRSRRDRHRARSADSHSTHHRKDDEHRDGSRMTKVRERFDSLDMRERGLAATVGGALAGGLAGRQLGKSRLTTLAGAAAGALGGRVLSDRRSK
jgi:hypothetical protein